LNLGYPTEVEATAIGGMNTETYPIGSKIRFQFPARKTQIPAMHKTFFHRHDTLEQSPVTLWWYDGGNPLSETPSSDETKPKTNHRGGHDGSNKPPAETHGGHRRDARRNARQRLSAHRRQGDHFFPGRLRRTVLREIEGRNQIHATSRKARS